MQFHQNELSMSYRFHDIAVQKLAVFLLRQCCHFVSIVRER